MKINWGLIKFLVLTSLVVFLFSFTKKRNATRNLSKIDIEFLDDNEPFITRSTVNKLLIQNHDSVTGIVKEALVLKEAEARLRENKMIRDAEVFITVDGVLGARIEQRNPIARVAASNDYYLDADGKNMPLSRVYSARVPIVRMNSKVEVGALTTLLLKMRDDDFMKMSVVGLNVSNDGLIEMQLRKQDFKIIFGKAENIEKKFQNFKAFYQKAKMDSTLQSYKTVDLQFGSQVVATKK
ncbi:cell division protein FtsQ/DivIB [Jejudonia soesokkakensis]|uniref:Cell division protein FtsQ/DivIB n=1 Tax=Jejudonia soesokkakensis TaxID=1323432 RepID=A0ABW2MR31_9FLAO